MDVLNNPIVAIIGILSSVVGIVSALLPAQSRKTRFLHIAYSLAIVALAVPLTLYATTLSRIRRAERAARELVAHREMDFTDAGFVQASLAFLEANRDVFPDTYARAKRMCEEQQCYGGTNTRPDQFGRSIDMVDLSFTMAGLLRGISVVESDK